MVKLYCTCLSLSCVIMFSKSLIENRLAYKSPQNSIRHCKVIDWTLFNYAFALHIRPTRPAILSSTAELWKKTNFIVPLTCDQQKKEVSACDLHIILIYIYTFGLCTLCQRTQVTPTSLSGVPKLWPWHFLWASPLILTSDGHGCLWPWPCRQILARIDIYIFLFYSWS